MISTAITTCLHCNAALTSHETSEGWCDSCGKRLPASATPAPARAVAKPPEPQPVAGTDWLLWGTLSAVMLGVAGLSFLAYVR